MRMGMKLWAAAIVIFWLINLFIVFHFVAKYW